MAGQRFKGDVDPHGQELRIIVFDCQEGVVFLMVEVLERHQDQKGCNLHRMSSTARATIVKTPPVAVVSYWSVWIFLKKSKDFNIVEYNTNVSVQVAEMSSTQAKMPIPLNYQF